MTISLVILFVTIKLQFHAQTDTNYWHYHELIYKAECVMFDSNKNVEQGFQYYDQAFNNFEFNYLHDLVNAAQLAHYYHRDYMKYLKKAVGYGLHPANLNFIPVWQEQTVVQEFLDYFQSAEGQAVRKQYLSTINQDYLAWLYQLSLTELKYRRSSDEHYREHFTQWDQDLLAKINEYGFPGARLVGVDDPTLYRDLQNKQLDYNGFVKRGSDSLCLPPNTALIPCVMSEGDTLWMSILDTNWSCPEMDYVYLSQSLLMLYVVHHSCPMKIFLAVYDEIAKGNLHPREYTYMLDNSHVAEQECDCEKYSRQFFRIGNYNQEMIFKNYFLPEDETDALRKQYWIVPLRVERAKEQFGAEHGYRFNWGMNNCYK